MTLWATPTNRWDGTDLHAHWLSGRSDTASNPRSASLKPRSVQAEACPRIPRSQYFPRTAVLLTQGGRFAVPVNKRRAGTPLSHSNTIRIPSRTWQSAGVPIGADRDAAVAPVFCASSQCRGNPGRVPIRCLSTCVLDRRRPPLSDASSGRLPRRSQRASSVSIWQKLTDGGGCRLRYPSRSSTPYWLGRVPGSGLGGQESGALREGLRYELLALALMHHAMGQDRNILVPSLTEPRRVVPYSPAVRQQDRAAVQLCPFIPIPSPYEPT
jgi:hypothetical protein